MVPHTPYTNATTFAFVGLCGDYAILVTSPHHQITTPRSATPIYTPCTYTTMDSGFRSSDAPRIEVRSIFRSPKELLAAAPKRVPRGWSRLHSWKRRWKLEEVILLRRAPRGEKGEKSIVGCPSSDPSMYCYVATRTRSNSNVLIYGYDNADEVSSHLHAAAC